MMLLNDAVSYQDYVVCSGMNMEHWWNDTDGRAEVLAEKPVFQNLGPVLGPTQPSVQGVSWVLSPGVKQVMCEADSSLPSIAEVKNEWSYTSTSPVWLPGIDKDNCTFFPLYIYMS
jgi:hypothetical protein